VNIRVFNDLKRKWKYLNQISIRKWSELKKYNFIQRHIQNIEICINNHKRIHFWDFSRLWFVSLFPMTINFNFFMPCVCVYLYLINEKKYKISFNFNQIEEWKEQITTLIIIIIEIKIIIIIVKIICFLFDFLRD